MPMVEVNGARLNYLQVSPEHDGEVEDLVMVHGLATNMAFWYFRYAPQFVERFRVTVFDLRGHGHSEMTPSGYRPQDMGADLSGLLDHLGIRQAHFLAHSFGGVAVLNMAVREPERVRSLILADTHLSAARHGGHAQRWEEADRIQAVLDAHGLKLNTREPYFGYRLLTEMAHQQSRGVELPDTLKDLVAPIMGQHGRRTASKWLKLMDTTAAESELLGNDGLTLDRLRSLQFPILAMYGDRSQARLTGAELLHVWPQAAFRRVRDAGHFFPTTRPQEVTEACERFWDGEFTQRPRHRAGDVQKNHFRSDRVYEHEGQWYCRTREEVKVGPFSAPEEVKDFLSKLMSGLVPARSRA